MIDCKYCKRHIPYDANVCPYCGRSIKDQKDSASADSPSEVQETPAQYANTEGVNNEKSNKWLYVIIVILILLLLCFVGYFLLNQPTGKTEPPVQADTTYVDTTNEGSAAQTAPSVAPVAKPLQKGMEIVVNGEGVRMRFGPSLKAGYLKTRQGGTLSVNKGTRLPCIGEDGDWYKVVYQGKQYYMSKQFCYPAKN